MEITEVKVTLRDNKKLKAFASVTFDNSFVVRGMKVIQGKNGTFIAMPSRKKPDGTYQDVAHPINNETRQMIEERIMEEYHKEVEENGTSSADDSDDTDEFDISEE